MKTKIALFLTVFTLAGGVFAGQPGVKVTFNNKGQVISVVRTSPVAAAPASKMACASMACCAKNS